MLIKIIGNGPSSDGIQLDGDINITCNYARPGADYLASNHINWYGWTAIPTITKHTRRPRNWDSRHSLPSSMKWEKVYPDRSCCYSTEFAVDGLRVWVPKSQEDWIDTGPVACIWARTTHPLATIEAWGFDSLTTGDLTNPWWCQDREDVEQLLSQKRNYSLKIIKQCAVTLC